MNLYLFSPNTLSQYFCHQTRSIISGLGLRLSATNLSHKLNGRLRRCGELNSIGASRRTPLSSHSASFGRFLQDGVRRVTVERSAPSGIGSKRFNNWLRFKNKSADTHNPAPRDGSARQRTFRIWGIQIFIYTRFNQN